VYAPECTGRAILDGIKAGHVTLSYAPDAGYLEFFADIDNDDIDDVMMGDNVVVDTETEITLTIKYMDPSSDSDENDVVSLSPATIKNLVSNTKSVNDLFASLGDIKIIFLYKSGVLHKGWVLYGGADTIFHSETIGPDEQVYYRAEIFGKTDIKPILRLLYGMLMGLTNPIYVNY
jgi:hypothetical protein